MAESTLTVAFRELQAEIGQFLGWGSGAYYGQAAWDARKQGVIDSGTRKGLRRFYFSALLPGEPAAHDWSFLRPTASLILPSAATILSLPDDFGGMEGTAQILAATDNSLPFPIMQVGIGRIRSLFAPDAAATGPPEYVAVVPVKGAATGQRFELHLFPGADQQYTVELEYYILPDCLTGTLPYCYGGAPHSGTILEGCLAAVERDEDNARGVHEQHYQELLAASISYDRNLKAQTLGYNADRSDDAGLRGRAARRVPYATFAGVLYDGEA